MQQLPAYPRKEVCASLGAPCCSPLLESSLQILFYRRELQALFHEVVANGLCWRPHGHTDDLLYLLLRQPPIHEFLEGGLPFYLDHILQDLYPQCGGRLLICQTEGSTERLGRDIEGVVDIFELSVLQYPRSILIPITAKSTAIESTASAGVRSFITSPPQH